MTKLRGATLVEVVVSMGVMLALACIFVWLTLQIYALNTLNSSVRVGLRLGVTRGDSSRVGGNFTSGEPDGVLSDLSWAHTNCEAVNTQGGMPNEALDLLRTMEISRQDAYDYMTGTTIGAFTTNNPSMEICRMPKPYIYTLAYTYEAMSQSLGWLVRYPCDPLAADGAGCLSCRFLNPRSPSSPFIYSGMDKVLMRPSARDIFYECRYRPRIILGDTIAALLGTNNPVITLKSSIRKKDTERGYLSYGP
jgi:hypothetical protein